MRYKNRKCIVDIVRQGTLFKKEGKVIGRRINTFFQPHYEYIIEYINYIGQRDIVYRTTEGFKLI